MRQTRITKNTWSGTKSAAALCHAGGIDLFSVGDCMQMLSEEVS